MITPTNGTFLWDHVQVVKEDANLFQMVLTSDFNPPGRIIVHTRPLAFNASSAFSFSFRTGPNTSFSCEKRRGFQIKKERCLRDSRNSNGGKIV